MMTAERTYSLVENYASLRGLLGTYGPESLTEIRDASLRRFRLMGLPTTRDEEFKYLPLHGLEGEFAPAYGATVDSSAASVLPLGDLDAVTLTFVNGQYAPELSNVSGLPEGALVRSMLEALEEAPDLVLHSLGKVATYEGKLGSTNDDRFVALNGAFLGEGAFVHLRKGVVVESPIHLRFLNLPAHGAFASHPRILIVLEEAAQAKVVESHSALADHSLYFSNVVEEIRLGKNAILEHVKFQNESPVAIHLANQFSHQESGSTLTATSVLFGGAVSRADVNAFVDGEHCETWLNGAYFGTGEQLIDNHTRIDHAKPNCHSFEVYKGVLDDKSVGVFNGKIFVYEDAQKTDAKQTNQAILLSPTATINTKPQLEIFADDVKCTHGATVGQIGAEQLFYLRSRGIPEAQARKLLVYAFVAEAIEKITIDPVREALEKVLYEKLA